MLAQLDVIPTITIEPKDAVMRPGQSWTFTAEIVGEHDLAWHVSHGELVVVGNSATYTPPPGIVGPVNIEARSVQDSTKSGVATVYVLDDETQDLVLHTNGRFARLMVDSMPNSWEFGGVTKRLYQDFEDEFDFVLIFRHGIPGICGLGAFVNQTVSGIGLDEIDANATYGSQGRLLGVPFVGVESGANRSTFGFPYRLVAQSIMKVWGNWLFEPYPFWGFTSGNGLMGGFDRNTLVALPNDRYQATAGDGTGTFTTGPKLRPFSEIELYLMGLAPAEEVPPILVAEGAQWVDGEHGLFTADAITEYTIADIIAEHGPRSPAFGEAPNSFRILTVIITEESLTRATLDGLDRGLAIIGDQGNSDIKANPWEYSFHTLTGGRGTVRTDGIFDALK